MSVRLLFLLSLLLSVEAVRYNCSFTHSDGYSLRWLVIGDEILFHLDFSDFPTNAYTGVGFETEDGSDSDSIIVQVNEEGEVDVFSVDLQSDSTVLSEDTVAVLSANYSENNLRAEFSRPLATELTDLNDCVTWNFITTPKSNTRTGSYGGRLRIPSRTKICDVKRNCDIWAQFSSALENAGAISRISTVLENYRKVRASLGSSHSEAAKSKSMNENRKKRQSGSSYTPTDNIYGYDYRSSASDSSPTRLVVNPNYAFLNENLTSGYAENYVQAERNYEQNSGSLGTSPGTVAMNDAIVSNEQQNIMNYQRIQQTSFSNPSTTQQYSNNGYAYADSGSTSVRTGPQIIRGQTASTPTNYQVSSSISTATASAPYQSVADLKTTRLRDPSSSSSSNVYTSGSSSQAMFYPYRTDTQPVYGGSQSSSSQSGQLAGSQVTSGTVFRDASTDPCSLSDPYWCSDYVKIYLESSTQLSRFSKQTACQSLAQSLQDSYNGCCQTMRAAGCS